MFQEFIHYGRDLEKAVLGICLMEKLAFSRCYDLVSAEEFYLDDHQQIFRSMAEMYDKSMPIDYLTLAHYMTEKKVNLNAGGIAYYLTVCTAAVVSSAHLEYWCHLIREMWKRREIMKLTSAQLSDLDTRKSIQSIHDQVQRIVGGEYKKDWYDMSEVMYNLMMHQRDMVSGKKEFITSGFSAIDKLNGGFYAGQLIVIGARPSVGKSALMGKIAIAQAKKGKKVGIISLEMDNTSIAARLASLETDIEFARVYRDIAADQEMHRKFYDIISNGIVHLPIYLSDKTKVDINAIRSKAAKLRSWNGCDCIIVDYLQLVDSVNENRQYNREQEVAKISRGLKLLSMDMEIPVIVLCQLNRAVTNRKGNERYPRISDLRESGAIEQDADVVMFLHRDWMSGIETNDDGGSTERQADLLCAKWRNGGIFHLELEFDPPKMRFSEKQKLHSSLRPVTADMFQEPERKTIDEEDKPF